jgi:hypothetical protein
MYLLQLKIMNKNKIRWQADFLTGRKLSLHFFYSSSITNNFTQQTIMRLFIFLGRSLIAAFFIMGALQTLKVRMNAKTLCFYIAAILIFIRHN